MDESAPDGGDDGPAVGEDVEAAFSLLADETRLDILRELYLAEDRLSFSALRERVGIRDSGQFNYHLGKLTEQFVGRDEEGYTLTNAGQRVLGAVFAGSYDRQESVESIPIDGDCPLCGGTLVGGYEQDHCRVECKDCESTVITYPAPPGILRGRDRENLPKVFSRYVRTVLAQGIAGFCPFCLGPTEPELEDENVPEGVGVTYRCRHCGADMSTTTGSVLIDNREVSQFAHDHGIDFEEDPLWELDPIFDAEERRLDDEPGPAVVELSMTLDDETLTVRLDEDLSVIETSRS